MSVPVFRSIREGELEILAQLFHRAVHESARNHYTAAQLHAWSPGHIQDFLNRHQAYDAIIADIDGVIAGFSDLKPTGYIDKLYVNPDFGRSGVAQALLAHIEQRPPNRDRKTSRARESDRQGRI